MSFVFFTDLLFVCLAIMFLSLFNSFFMFLVVLIMLLFLVRLMCFVISFAICLVCI